MKQIYIDGGSQTGAGFDQISKMLNIDSTWTVHMFEPNPYAMKYIKEKYGNTPNITIHDAALYSENCSKNMNIGYDPGEAKDFVDGGSNILGDNFIKPSWISDEHMPHVPSDKYPVKCIDFAQFIDDNISGSDRATVKLDIEGCEFEVLDRLIDFGNLFKIKHFIIEWHYHMRKDAMTLKPQSYYLNIFEAYGISHTVWH